LFSSINQVHTSIGDIKFVNIKKRVSRILARRGWKVSKVGAVRDEDGWPMFKAGFVKAIEKVLAQV